jgi:hypothetical protein
MLIFQSVSMEYNIFYGFGVRHLGILVVLCLLGTSIDIVTGSLKTEV